MSFIFDTEIMITLFFYLEIHIGKAAWYICSQLFWFRFSGKERSLLFLLALGYLPLIKKGNGTKFILWYSYGAVENCSGLLMNHRTLFVENLLSWIIQALFIFLLLPFLSNLKGIPFAELPVYLNRGAACFLNIGGNLKGEYVSYSSTFRW